MFGNQPFTGERKAPELNPILKAKAKPTRGNAIKAMCAHCMGCTEESVEPGFRSLIRDCGSPKCPLFAFRPYRRSDDDEGEE